MPGEPASGPEAIAGTPLTPVEAGVGGGAVGPDDRLAVGDGTRLADGVAATMPDGPEVAAGVLATDGARSPGPTSATATTMTAAAASAPTGAQRWRWRAPGRSRT